jgi:hypothetical protein
MGASEIELEAIVDAPGPPAPDPGHAHAISITRYKVLRVLRGQYAHPFALVGHDLANLSSLDFRPGVRKVLRLTTAFPPHTSQLNPFARESPGVPALYCLDSRTLTNASDRRD